MITGSCWREQYTEEKIKDRHLLALAAKVEVVKDDALDALYDEKWPAIVGVRTTDGRLLSARRDIMKGEPEDPLSDLELKRKFNSLATDAVSAEHAERIWQAVFQMDERQGVSELTELLRVDR